MGGVTPEEVRAFVQRTCRDQGVPVLVTSPRVVAQVVALLGGIGSSAHGSGTPNGLNACGVEPVGPTGGGLDDHVIDHGLDGSALAVKVEGGPLAS